MRLMYPMVGEKSVHPVNWGCGTPESVGDTVGADDMDAVSAVTT